MTLDTTHTKARNRDARACENKTFGFTLIELLVVIAIIALLVAILMPSLAKARSLAKQAVCAVHVNNQLKGVHLYAHDYNDQIPKGPSDGHPFLPGSPPMNELADNQIWTGGGSAGQYNAHGALVMKYIPQAHMVFCPGDTSNQIADLPAALADEPEDDIRCSYMYRQLAGQKAVNKSDRLSSLGLNSQDQKVSALLVDMNSNMPTFAPPVRRNHHDLRRVTVGFADTHVLVLDNKNEELTATDSAVMGAGFNFVKVMADIMEYADKFGQ